MWVEMWVEMWVGIFAAIPSNLLKGMAGTTGLEPAASAVTGQRSNQLNYVPLFVFLPLLETRVFTGFPHVQSIRLRRPFQPRRTKF